MLPIVPEKYLDPIITPATSLAYKRKHLPKCQTHLGPVTTEAKSLAKKKKERERETTKAK